MTLYLANENTLGGCFSAARSLPYTAFKCWFIVQQELWQRTKKALDPAQMCMNRGITRASDPSSCRKKWPPKRDFPDLRALECRVLTRNIINMVAVRGSPNSQAGKERVHVRVHVHVGPGGGRKSTRCCWRKLSSRY